MKHFADGFGSQPPMTVEAIGCGMGTKDFPAANCVRALLGSDGGSEETVIRLECNVDDMTAEQIGYAQEALFSAGAREVFTVPAGMKKSRPGTVIVCICTDEKRDALIRVMFRETTTLGIRESRVLRHVLSRRVETLDTPFGPVRKKISEGFGVTREKYEYEDLARIAREKGVPLAAARGLIADDRRGL